MNLKKYWQVAKASWEDSFVYRLNFVMWRVRMVVGLLTVYFFWAAILKNRPEVFGYSQAALLTFILAGSFLRSLVFSSRSTSVQSDIAQGNLNNYLIRPINYFGYWLVRDAADKLLNLLFAVAELGLIFWLIKPPFILPVNWVSFLLAAMLAMIIYFYFSLLISMTCFWMPEHDGWPQRFFVFMILEFFSGGLFPLDILPQGIFLVVKNLPTAYMLHVPLQIYLGRISGWPAVKELGIMLLWLAVLAKLSQWVFRKGLKIYGAYGR